MPALTLKIYQKTCTLASKRQLKPITVCLNIWLLHGNEYQLPSAQIMQLGDGKGNCQGNRRISASLCPDYAARQQ